MMHVIWGFPRFSAKNMKLGERFRPFQCDSTDLLCKVYNLCGKMIYSKYGVLIFFGEYKNS